MKGWQSLSFESAGEMLERGPGSPDEASRLRLTSGNRLRMAGYQQAAGDIHFFQGLPLMWNRGCSNHRSLERDAFSIVDLKSVLQAFQGWPHCKERERSRCRDIGRTQILAR